MKRYVRYFIRQIKMYACMSVIKNVISILFELFTHWLKSSRNSGTALVYFICFIVYLSF